MQIASTQGSRGLSGRRMKVRALARFSWGGQSWPSRSARKRGGETSPQVYDRASYSGHWSNGCTDTWNLRSVFVAFAFSSLIIRAGAVELGRSVMRRMDGLSDSSAFRRRHCPCFTSVAMGTHRAWGSKILPEKSDLDTRSSQFKTGTQKQETAESGINRR